MTGDRKRAITRQLRTNLGLSTLNALQTPFTRPLPQSPHPALTKASTAAEASPAAASATAAAPAAASASAASPPAALLAAGEEHPQRQDLLRVDVQLWRGEEHVSGRIFCESMYSCGKEKSSQRQDLLRVDVQLWRGEEYVSGRIFCESMYSCGENPASYTPYFAPLNM